MKLERPPSLTHLTAWQLERFAKLRSAVVVSDPIAHNPGPDLASLLVAKELEAIRARRASDKSPYRQRGGTSKTDASKWKIKIHPDLARLRS
jgi:hypothetical protein